MLVACGTKPRVEGKARRRQRRLVGRTDGRTDGGSLMGLLTQVSPHGNPRLVRGDPGATGSSHALETPRLHCLAISFFKTELGWGSSKLFFRGHVGGVSTASQGNCSNCHDDGCFMSSVTIVIRSLDVIASVALCLLRRGRCRASSLLPSSSLPAIPAERRGKLRPNYFAHAASPVRRRRRKQKCLFSQLRSRRALSVSAASMWRLSFFDIPSAALWTMFHT